jgi:L-lactate dehydrogenase complex protein LldG
LARLRRRPDGDVPGLRRAVAKADWPPEERLRRFSERMEAVRAEVHPTDADGWPDVLLDLARAKGIGRLLYAPDTEHGRALAAAQPRNLELLAYEQPIEHWKNRMFAEVQGAVTGTRGAIAETGSLILWPDAREPRLMSLVPPLHFALLDAGRIYGTFAEAVAEQRWADGMPANALLVSGPSKSADIEQTLAYGVHGPKELIVLVLE